MSTVKSIVSPPAAIRLRRLGLAACALLLSLGSGTAYAYDPNGNPFLPTGCAPSRYAPVTATVNPIQIKVGSKIYTSTNGDPAKGAVLGYVDTADPTRSQIAVQFPQDANNGWTNWVTIPSWVEDQAGAIESVSVGAAQDVRNKDLPFSILLYYGNNTNAKYNGRSLLSIKLNPKSVMPLGTQIVNPSARKLITNSIARQQPYEIAMMHTYHLADADQWGVRTSLMWKDACVRNAPYSWKMRRLFVQPTQPMSIHALSGDIVITQGNLIRSWPKSQCENKGDRLECKLEASGPASAGFTLNVPDKYKAQFWFARRGETARNASISLGQLNEFVLVLPADYLSTLLGGSDESSLEAVPMLDLVPTLLPTLKSTFSPFESGTLKRITLAVSIEERNPAAGGQYAGVIGQDPDIAVPLKIIQQGDSKATKVELQVKADSVATARQGMRCRFASKDGKTVVGIASIVRLYDGSRHVDHADNCTGMTYDITGENWLITADPRSPYAAALNMDLVFPLDANELASDNDGNPWFGDVSASGEVIVRAEWQ